MSKGIKVLIGMVVLVIILFVVNQVIDKKKNDISNKDSYITINSEDFPTIYDKLGEKTITKVENGNDNQGKYIKVIYSDIGIVEVASYIEELGNLGYVLTDSSDNTAMLAKESTKEGMILSISIKYDINNTEFKYAKGSGTLVRE